MTAEEKILFNVNTSPHVRDPDSTPRIMFTVCLALAPALVWAVLVFGWHALVVVASSVAACVVAESLCARWRGVPNTIRDGSAVVTGLLLAAVSPANLPWWSIAVGAVFAVVIGKQVFGGLGHNVWNPALLGRAFMQVSMPDRMMSGEWFHLGLAGKWWDNIVQNLGSGFGQLADQAKTAAGGDIDLVTSATSLARIHLAHGVETAAGHLPPASLAPTWRDIFMTWFGVEGGSLGEVSAVLVILGGLFLIQRKIVNWDIPVFYIGTVAVLGFVLPHPFKINGGYDYTAWFQGPWLLHLGAGGLMIGAFFMATDMVTKPLTRSGRIVFGIGCGAVTMLIRLFAGYPEGVCYAILFMNTCVPFIDSVTRPMVFGKAKRK